MTDDNPYAPPLTAAPGGVPDAPGSFGWEVVGKAVMVKQSAQFPMIDPFTGASEETMMLQKVQVRYRPWWLLLFPLMGAVILAAFHNGMRDAETLFLVFPGLLFGWLLMLLAGMFLPVCTLRLFFTKRTLRIRKIGSRIMSALFLVGILGSFFVSKAPQWVQWIPGIALICWVVGVLVALALNRRLRCRRKSGERFEIRGFHPRALVELTQKA